MCALHACRHEDSVVPGAKIKWGQLCYEMDEPTRNALPFHLQKQIKLVEMLPSQVPNKEPADDKGGEMETLRISPTDGDARFYKAAEKMIEMHLFQEGEALFNEQTELHALGKVNEVSSKIIIPISDILAVVRNAVGLVLVILLIMGSGPLAPAVVVLFLLFSALLIVQGFLFAVPQGTFAWGAEGKSNFMIVRSLKDVKNEKTAAFKFLSGVLSVVEGCLWIALGITGVIPAIIMASPLLIGMGLPAIIPSLNAAAPVITFILFNVFFTISFAIMIPMGYRDYRRHKKFRNKITGILNQQGYQEVLKFLQGKMFIHMKPKYLNYSREELVAKAGRKIYRIREQMSADQIAEMKTIEGILARLERNEGAALEEAKELVKGALRANLTNLVADGLTTFLGIVGFFVGGFIYNILHFMGYELIGQLADFAAWIFLNFWFFVLDHAPSLEKSTDVVEKMQSLSYPWSQAVAVSSTLQLF